METTFIKCFGCFRCGVRAEKFSRDINCRCCCNDACMCSVREYSIYYFTFSHDTRQQYRFLLASSWINIFHVRRPLTSSLITHLRTQFLCVPMSAALPCIECSRFFAVVVFVVVLTMLTANHNIPRATNKYAPERSTAEHPWHRRLFHFDFTFVTWTNTPVKPLRRDTTQQFFRRAA